jgi:poly(A) polymerase
MIKKLIKKLLGQSDRAAPSAAALTPSGPPLGQRVEVPVAEHGIDPKRVDERALRVVRTLADAGFEAYIVGGAVRDLLVGLRPKDFDVATNATPEQVKNLFRRAFVIGRRFRIVHVVFGRGREHEVVEVSTFRAYLDAAAAEQVGGNEKTSKAELVGVSHAVDASGRVLRDNVWGPQVEDAARRDFTVNAMYYDPQREIVVDYHHGLRDAQQRVLRMIGDPETRYREDPVRILRVVRFAAKLGFAIEPKTQAPIRRMAAALEQVPASRLFDEMIKLLQTGHALASIEQLRAQGLLQGIFPVLGAAFDDKHPDPARSRFIELMLQDTDRRVEEGRSVGPSFMLASLLWHEVQARWQRLRKAGEAPVPALQQAIDAVFDARIGDISGRGKLAADMREIWMMQPRFERRSGRTPQSLVEQPRFRAGFDFLRLRADAGEAPQDLADWWEDFSLADEAEREALLAAVRDERPARRAASTREAGRSGAGAPAASRAAGVSAASAASQGSSSDADDETPSDDDASEGDEASEGGAAAPPARRRRRRRRKPGPAAGAGDGAPLAS